MNKEEFENFLNFINNSQQIIQSVSLRRKAYSEFNLVYRYLEETSWSEENINEASGLSEMAVFQNVAEGYYRLGFADFVFFEYAKLVYELWYLKAIKKQKEISKRLHKGTQVHQIAELYNLQNKSDKAWLYYLAGYTEDYLTGRDVKSSQAFRALIRYGISESILNKYVEFIKQLTDTEVVNPLETVALAQRKYILPTFDENASIDPIKFNNAVEVWVEFKKEKEL